eukprot:Gb_40191 [translate_table: standard]
MSVQIAIDLGDNWSVRRCVGLSVMVLLRKPLSQFQELMFLVGRTASILQSLLQCTPLLLRYNRLSSNTSTDTRITARRYNVS